MSDKSKDGAGISFPDRMFFNGVDFHAVAKRAVIPHCWPHGGPDEQRLEDDAEFALAQTLSAVFMRHDQVLTYDEAVGIVGALVKERGLRVRFALEGSGDWMALVLAAQSVFVDVDTGKPISRQRAEALIEQGLPAVNSKRECLLAFGVEDELLGVLRDFDTYFGARDVRLVDIGPAWLIIKKRCPEIMEWLEERQGAMRWPSDQSSAA